MPTAIGAGLMSFISDDNQVGKLAGIYLINSIVAPLAIIFSWVGANTMGYTKRVAANASVAIAYAIANIIGPQTFQAHDAPEYLPAKITIFAVSGAAMVVSICLRCLYGYRNSTNVQIRREQLATLTAMELAQANEGDLTDRQNPAFVYVY
ncbi:hypothetical protein FOPG_18345 [Fusarium oxysporum f. sp. conglutinans race 2 54008]|uniref:Allantoate permease n=1 Tax=Fusarium oxysporum f. sp. conglutinans race 2 54008 TaxID=1089457 RepID=X0GQ41_FUSOX|nr:hypothetical protein FOPG_18345 [Fusarium oxysporum f. sp. conglutinans race 2 54008]KAG6989494.1 putative transporter [Fusarium oxysporum f. sp. conglutinans]